MHTLACHVDRPRQRSFRVRCRGFFVGASMPEAEQNATRILSASELTALLAEVDAPEGEVDKRNRQRRELSIPMAFMPVSTGGKRSPDQAVRVTAKDISETGIGLLHEG